MATNRVGFARQYRAALLDYLLGSGESGRERAYGLGRRALEMEVGPLQLLSIHHAALAAVLSSVRTRQDRLTRLRASDEFLMEALSTYEAAYRGYVDLAGVQCAAMHLE